MGAPTSRTFPSYSDAVDSSGVRFVASAERNTNGKSPTFWLNYLLPHGTTGPERLERRLRRGSTLSLVIHGDEVAVTEEVIVRGYNVEEGARFGQVEVEKLKPGFRHLFMQRAQRGHV